MATIESDFCDKRKGKNIQHNITALLHHGLKNFLVLLLFLLALFCINGFALAASAGEAENRLDKRQIEAVAAMLIEKPAGFGRPISNRAAWEELARKESYHLVIPLAEILLKEPIPQQPDNLYLDFSRTGNRTHWQRVSRQRRDRIKWLVLAECLENKERFLEAIEEIVRILCSERTWVMPAHDRDLANFKGERTDIDLGSARLAWNLATADYLLGNKLSSDTRKLIRDNIGHRIFEPFRDMATGKREANWWFSTTNNWNAVCLANVTGSALALLESRQDRALFVVAAEKYSKNFLRGFTPDGYCTEGVDYWNYGFGHYLLLAESVYQSTRGRVDFLDSDHVRRVANYGSHIEIVNGVYPAFADCSVMAQPSPWILYYVSRRFGLGLRRWENRDLASSESNLYLTMMLSFQNSASQTPVASEAFRGTGLRSWFNQGGILICRPVEDTAYRLGVALKGGHNDEHHNHNDVGSFIAVVGSRALLVDPGREVYTKRTFSSRRYDSKVLNSFGHSVPIVAGKLQKTGRYACGRVLHTEFTDETDTLVLDIRPAYDVQGLEKLERTFVYSREGNGSLTVTDRVKLANPESFGVALITFDQWAELGLRTLLIYDSKEAIRVDVKTTGQEFEIHHEEIQENLETKTFPTRLGINLKQPVSEATISIEITPYLSIR
jgi:hypothetical protein